MPEDYNKWFLMMETEFGTRFNKLFRGPAWSGCPKEDVNYSHKVNTSTVQWDYNVQAGMKTHHLFCYNTFPLGKILMEWEKITISILEFITFVTIFIPQFTAQYTHI